MPENTESNQFVKLFFSKGKINVKKDQQNLFGPSLSHANMKEPGAVQNNLFVDIKEMKEEEKRVIFVNNMRVVLNNIEVIYNILNQTGKMETKIEVSPIIM